MTRKHCIADRAFGSGMGVSPMGHRAVPALFRIFSTGETPVGLTGKMPVPPRIA